MFNLSQFGLPITCIFFQLNMWFVSISCTIFLYATFVFSSFCDPVIKITTGEVRGHILKSRDGRDFYSFSGIPYAKPPIGDLRFKVIFQNKITNIIINYSSTNKTIYYMRLKFYNLF